MADTRSSESKITPYAGKDFEIDEKQNLLFKPIKAGVYKAKLTPDLHANYAYVDVEMTVLPGNKLDDLLNIPPHFVSPLPILVNYDFSDDQKIMAKLNDQSLSQFHHIEKRIQLPQIKDIDGTTNFKEMKIEDVTMDKKVMKLGSIVSKNTGETTLGRRT